MNDAFLQDIRQGFSQPQKTLPPKWLYDQQGSELFEAITKTEEYYPTRTEAGILSDAYPSLRRHCPPGAAIAEFGSGAGIKSRRLIEALKPSVYISIDVSKAFLDSSCEILSRLFPEVEIHGVVADFSGDVALPPVFFEAPTRMAFFPGSTIGNFEDGGAQTFLQKSRDSLGDGSLFLIGADLVKDQDILLAAYDDAAGITRRFTKNILARMKRELGADLDMHGFEAVALWNGDKERMELGVMAEGDQTIRIGEERFALVDGEMVLTEFSHKYTLESFGALAGQSGWAVDHLWTDESNWFGVFLLKAA